MTVGKNHLFTVVLILAFLFGVQKSTAQLGRCGGNSGIPIFTEDFGSGTTPGPALPMGTTSYTFTAAAPQDGSYTISSATDFFDWRDIDDHTPGDTNGKAFIVNANFTAGEFYSRRVDGLCENTSYEFSSWLINLLPETGCEGAGIPVNVRFEIWDALDTQRLAFGDTGDLFSDNDSVWEQYALVFQTLPGQTAIILKMRNNANGGCGNDLAIDDIVFKSCGDLVSLSTDTGETEILRCENAGPISTVLAATPDFSVYSSHVYQWQESTDGENWNDIPNATNATYTPNNLIQSTSYRVKVAEDAQNLDNALCNVLSDTFNIRILPVPPPPAASGDRTICEGERATLNATVGNPYIVDWYDAPADGALLEANTTDFTTSQEGTYYAEARVAGLDCSSTQRTPVSVTVNPLPEVGNTIMRSVCPNGTVELDIRSNGVTDYRWNTGERGPVITVGAPGTYSVSLTNAEGCSAVQAFEVFPVETPVIMDISSQGAQISVQLENEGDFEYALDNGNFQTSPIFDGIRGGRYTVRVRDRSLCSEIRQDYLHIVIPAAFTPNGDNINDFFLPEGLEIFNRIDLSIFNRFGQLLHYDSGNDVSWDGDVEQRPMPSGNYWYLITADSIQRKGPVLLKR